MATWVEAWFSVIVNISVKTLWCYAIHTIFAFFMFSIFFQIMVASLSLAWHDQDFIIFYCCNFLIHNVFELTSFPFKTKYNNTVVYSVNSNYSFSRRKPEKNCWNNSLIKSTVYLLIFRQHSTIFKGSPKSLKKSYFTEELKLGES